MSRSPTVDANYRLQAADLKGIARQVVVANVTFQGLENMTPVVHFEGQSKRLVLSVEQVEQMIGITGTSLFPQWIGTPVVLQPRKDKGQTRILIKALSARQRGQPMPTYVPEDKRGWRLALAVVGVLLAGSFVYAALNATALLAVVQQLRDNWPLR